MVQIWFLKPFTYSLINSILRILRNSKTVTDILSQCQNIMFGTTDPPNSIRFILTQFWHYLCDIISGLFDYSHFIATAGTNRIQNTRCTNDLRNRPRIILRLGNEHWGCYKLVKVLRKHTILFGVGKLFYTLRYWRINLSI